MKKDLKKEVLEKIKKEEVKVRPKSFFVALKIFLGAFLIFLGIAAAYIFNLSFYLPRRAGAFGRNLTPPIILNSIPWGLVLIGAVVIGVLIYLYKNYEGGYRKNLLLTVIITTVVIIVAGWLMSVSRFNERLEQRPHFRWMYEEGERRFMPGKGKFNSPGSKMMPLRMKKNEIFRPSI